MRFQTEIDTSVCYQNFPLIISTRDGIIEKSQTKQNGKSKRDSGFS
jgi:hypothetical protein